MNRALVTALALVCVGACAEPSSDPAGAPAAVGVVGLALGGPDDPAPLTAPGTASGSLASNASYYYKVTVPSGHDGLRVAVRASANVDVYVRRVSSTGGALRASYDDKLHTHFFSAAETTADSQWFIEVHGVAAATYDLAVETTYARALTWDTGAALLGDAPFARPTAGYGDYLFKITSKLPRWGVWRNVLRVSAGEADLFMGTSAPSASGGSYDARVVGSDAIFFAQNQVQANDTWYLRVHALDGAANWSVLSGDIRVVDKGQLAADASSGGSIPTEVGGIAWFTTEVTAAALAWRLAAPASHLYVNDTAAPIPGNTGTYDVDAPNQILVVPSYLKANGYIVAVQAATPSQSAIVVDSRRQTVRTPSAEPSFSGSGNFAFTVTGADDGGFGFVTYRVDVPVQQIAWQLETTATSGHVDLYIRKGSVPADWDNAAMSETSGAAQSIAVSPPTLTDGAWYVTVKGQAPFTFKLTSGNPVVTPIAFINDPTTVPNGAAHQGEVGWRYFVVDDIDSQPLYLGWILELQNQVPSTTIAIRKNQVPSRYAYRQRTNGYSSTGETTHYDASSDTGFLERPEHEADIWYIGIESPDAPLGAFSLRTRAVTAADLSMNGGTVDVANQTSGRWRWFKTTVPSDALGWDVRLVNVTSGMPRMVVRAERPPAAFGHSPYLFYQGPSWPSGAWWAPDTDLSRRPYRTVQQAQVDERGRIFTAGLGSPLDPGVYYIGVSDLYTTPAGTPLTYRIQSRGIGAGATWSLPVTTLNFNGGQAQVTGLAPRELRAYRVDVPAGAPSFALELVPSVGDATLALRKGNLPNLTADYQNDSESTYYHAGLLRAKLGTDLYYRYPNYNETTLSGGSYYLLVTGEGVVTAADGLIGTGTTSYTLRSVGEVPVLGSDTLEVGDGAPLHWNNVALRYGEQKLHRFRVADGVSSLEIRLTTDAGQPYYAVGPGLGVPTPTQTYVAAEGGGAVVTQGNGIQTIQGPDGVYTVVVTAQYSAQGVAVNAQYDLDIIARGESVIDFNGGSAAVVAQEPQTWRYFKVIVPDDALGWDLRLANVQSGNPRMVIRRDELPGAWYVDPSCCPALYQRDTWETGQTWPVSYDMTQRPYDRVGEGYLDTTGRAVQMGLGAPLTSGTYYVGIGDTYNASYDDAMSYEIVSRGIGIGDAATGGAWTIQVADLPFEGSDTVTVAARDVAYYRVEVPEGSSSWDVELDADAIGGGGEAALLVSRDHLPNSTGAANASPDPSYYYGGGARRQKPGDEYFYRYPDYDTTTIPSGTYYLAVVGEGVLTADDSTSYAGTGSSTVTLTSHGEVEVTEASAPLGEGEPIRWDGEALRYGEHAVYRFDVPEGTTGMEVRFANASGAPYFDIGKGKIPSPSQTYQASYGGDGNVIGGASVVTLAEPVGSYYVVVSAHYTPQGLPVDATYDLIIEAIGDQVVPFNGGSVASDAQLADTWRYFRVNVPEDTLGWDVSLEDVTDGSPQMVIMRDEQPTSFYTDPSCCPPIYARDTWESGWRWGVYTDVTQRPYGPYDDNGPTDYVAGRHVHMGLGSPLVPGVYIIGVTNYASDTAPMSYRVVSRGIGVGDDAAGAPWVIQVQDLALDATVDTADLAPRDIAYYRVVVPQGTESFGVELETLTGESLMAVRRGVLPNAQAHPDVTADSDYDHAGTRRSKPGGEFFYTHPRPGLRSIEPDGPGTWYVAVAAEGEGAYSTSYIGTGTSRARLTTVSPVPIIGDASKVVDTGEVRFDDEDLRYGERKLYRFRVASDVPAFEVRLTNRRGSPRFSADIERYFDPAAPSDDAYYYYYRPADNGEYPEGSADIAATFVATPGDVTVAVYAYSATAEDMGYDLVITPVRPTELAWDGGLANLSLKDDEVHFFHVEVPADCDGVAQAGWILRQDATAGTMSVQVRKDYLPGDASGQTQTLATTAKESVIVPPLLEPGNWYVSVTAEGLTQGAITTEEVKEERLWVMPPRGVNATTPGLTHPVFADTGVKEDGTPISNQGSGDQGVDLGEGRFRFYRVSVPADNRGYLRTRLEAISGDPELYIRRGAAPTLSHGLNYQYGSISDYRDTSDGTSYGHWVPTNARNGTELAPGDYWVAVYAQSSNVRYRLIMDVGNITDLAQDGGGRTNQPLAAGDMRLYRIAVPKTNVPTDWHLNLVQQSGDVVVLLREEIPAGFYDFVPEPAYAESYIADWNEDREAYAYDYSTMPFLEETGALDLTLPLVRPDTTYLVSVFARTDATYDLSSTIGAGRLALDGTLDWQTGALNVTLPAGASRTYRIDVPADAARWVHHATVPVDGVWLYLSQGLIPPRNTYAHWSNNGYAYDYYNDLDRVLLDPGAYVGNFPFVPGESYYLVLENKTGAPQAVSYTLGGRRYDDDDDHDGLPDGWEARYFGQYGTTPDTDSDGDLLTNGAEQILGTDPNDIDTDDDALLDGDEAIAGADPLVPDSDHDSVCDGADSAPDDPNESGPIIRLYMGHLDGGAYGNGYGTNKHRTRLVAVFDKTYGPKAYWLHFTAWGITEVDAVEVLLNGVPIGYLPVGGADSESIARMFWIADADVRQGVNRVELRQKTAGASWGVKELGLFTFGESFGADSSRAYDVHHPRGVDFVVPAIGDVLLELATFDLEREDDVSITLGGAPFLPRVPGSANLRWGPRWQVPVLAEETVGGGRVLSIRPRVGSDGDYQVRWVDCRPLLSTFGTESVGGEDGHARAALGFLLPEASGMRELVVDWRVSDDEQVALGGTLEESMTYDSVGYYTWTPELSFAPAARDGAATVTWARVPAAEPEPYPTFVIGVRYYGPCTDYDGDSVNDCADHCAGDDADCDGVSDDLDCAPDDASVTTTNVGDADCDGVGDSVDCGPDDASVTASNVGDADCDGVGDGEDCAPEDAGVTASNVGDADCDGVGDGVDCGPNDASVTATNVGDADCDGVGDGVDCGPNDASVTTTNAGDADCDGVGDAVDCAPNNASVTTTTAGDADCDGVGDADDCAPNNASVTTTNVGDADCDGVGDASDCAPTNPAITASNVGDADCDGVGDASDCAPADPLITASNVGDQDCDGVGDGVDCQPTNAQVATSNVTDGDCDGVRVGLDCDDANAAVGSRDGDLDCDGVPQLVDCDDADPSAGSSVGDADCDEVPTADDCDDRDPRIGSRAADQDCDGVAAGVDCDDTDPSVALSCIGCVDADHDEHYALGNGCSIGDDCDDDDADGTTVDEDADCDGSLTADDCDDEDAEVVGACPAACKDVDGDGAFALASDCPSGRDCDDADADGFTIDADADCDGVENADDVCPGVVDDQADSDHDGVGDACDVCPSEPDPGQSDGDGDGHGDACVDGDADGVPDHRDNCPHAANTDQADADGDGLGDACDVTIITTEDGGCGGGGVVLGWSLLLLAIGAGLGRRRRA